MSSFTRDKKAQLEYEQVCEAIRLSTSDLPLSESLGSKQKRKQALLEDFTEFCKYYFPRLIDGDFAWFHKAAAKEWINNPTTYSVWEWPRGHAKSTIARLLLMHSLCKGEVTSCIVVSSNLDKAVMLLDLVQAELEFNQRLINDYGQFKGFDWAAGSFITKSNIGFQAFGRGQSPRGYNVGGIRPNHILVDDLDDKELVANPARVEKVVDWVREDLYGCFDVKRSGRIVVAGNRIHKASVLAHLVGDVEQGDPKDPAVYHLKVYAMENTKRGPDLDNGQPAWKERYTREMLLAIFAKSGMISARREYFHEHIVKGRIFKNEHIVYTKPLPLHKYDAVVSYCDSSHADTGDYKAIMLVGRAGINFHVLKVFCRQTSRTNMVQAHFDLYWHCVNANVSAMHYIEMNSLQVGLMDEYMREAESQGRPMPIKGDNRKKDKKETRIEALEPFFTRKLISFAEGLQSDPDFRNFLDQLLTFPGPYDDGPDALEGAIWMLQTGSRLKDFKPPVGKYRYNPSRG